MFRIAAVLLVAFLIVVAARGEPGDPQAGRQLYVAKMCNMCHTVAGESGPMAELGGSLDDVGARRDAAWLQLYLTDPKAAIPSSTMPKADLTEDQLHDIVAYLLTLTGPAGEP